MSAYHSRPGEGAKAVVTLLLAAAIIPTIRRLQLRHIHAHWATMPALAAYFVKQVIGIPYSLTAHAWDIYRETTMIREKLEAADFVVTCTAANLAELRSLGADPKRLFLSYHGLDFAQLPPPCFERPSGLRILAVGRLEETKGFADLMRACDLLSGSNVRFSCDIIGSGSQAGALRNLISQYGLTKAVNVLQPRRHSEIISAYQLYTVLAVPSVIGRDGDRDGIPNVIIEAMSQGLPVVASSVSGIPEVVQPNTGWLVRAGDPAALAAALRETYAGARDVRQRLVAAYELVRNRFDVDRNTATLLGLFSRSTLLAGLDCRNVDAGTKLD
jgi:glycosyltransferase involved in cell wall biosynthesis